MQVGDVALDPDDHEVRLDGEPLTLPLKEFELLDVLLANAGRALPRDTLIDRVWGSDYVGDTKTLDVHVKRLRSKIEPDPANPTASSPSGASATSTNGSRHGRRSSCSGQSCASRSPLAVHVDEQHGADDQRE